jgi:hypothetical protein
LWSAGSGGAFYIDHKKMAINLKVTHTLTDSKATGLDASKNANGKGGVFNCVKCEKVEIEDGIYSGISAS